MLPNPPSRRRFAVHRFPARWTAIPVLACSHIGAVIDRFVVTGALVKSVWKSLTIFLLFATMSPAPGQSGLFHRAENQVQIALIAVKRNADHTEIQLEALSASRGGVCWNKAGPDSPYLIAEERRFRFTGGDNITSCPERRLYREREIMVLRFEPLPPEAREFSLVEGEGGEDQMRGIARPNETFWNFLYVKLN